MIENHKNVYCWFFRLCIPCRELVIDDWTRFDAEVTNESTTLSPNTWFLGNDCRSDFVNCDDDRQIGSDDESLSIEHKWMIIIFFKIDKHFEESLVGIADRIHFHSVKEIGTCVVHWKKGLSFEQIICCI